MVVLVLVLGWALFRKTPDQPASPSLPAATVAPKHGTGNGVGHGPSWMSDESWQERLSTYRRQGRDADEILQIKAHLEQRGPRGAREQKPGRDDAVTRADFVPKETETAYLTRNGAGRPNIKLVDTGDRLSIWSPEGAGAFINPKGPGIRHFGLYASYATGADYYERTFRSADVSMGAWVDLVRDPDNEHDRNAVAICPPGSSQPFAYVQKARAAAIARRMDQGEDMAAISLRGPGPGSTHETAFLLIGSRSDLEAMTRPS